LCSGIVLEKVCEYFYYNEKFKNAKDVPDMDIPPELCLELLMAADYLNSTFAIPLRVGCWVVAEGLQREVWAIDAEAVNGVPVMML
jgi:hypothetical protein